jgi:hypothetical protein
MARNKVKYLTTSVTLKDEDDARLERLRTKLKCSTRTKTIRESLALMENLLDARDEARRRRIPLVLVRLPDQIAKFVIKARAKDH